MSAFAFQTLLLLVIVFVIGFMLGLLLRRWRRKAKLKAYLAEAAISPRPAAINGGEVPIAAAAASRAGEDAERPKKAVDVPRSAPEAEPSMQAKPPSVEAEASSEGQGKSGAPEPQAELPFASQAPSEAPSAAPETGGQPVTGTGDGRGDAAYPGRRPPRAELQDGETADNLKLLKGIGPQNEQRLNGLGIYHFRQIAAWTDDEVRWVGSYLAFPGRIEREDWIGQAKALLAGTPAEQLKLPARKRR